MFPAAAVGDSAKGYIHSESGRAGIDKKRLGGSGLGGSRLGRFTVGEGRRGELSADLADFLRWGRAAPRMEGSERGLPAGCAGRE